MDKIVESLVKKSVKQISPYVPGKPIEVLQRDYNIDPSKIIKLASNENPLGVSPKVKEAVTRYLDNIYRYPEGSGYYLKNKLSEILKVSPEKIILGSGSSEIISMAIDTFVNPGEEIIYPYPSFLIYKILALKTNATPVEIPLNEDFSYDLNKFLDKITSNTKMIILCNPNNPSGTIIFEDQLEEFINNVPDRVIIIVDEAYIEYVENKKFGKSLNYIDKKNIIISRTFSKIYGLAGLRMGYGVSKEDIISYMERIRPPFNTTGPGQEAAIAALGDKEFFLKSFKNNIKGKEYLYSEFKKLKIEYIPTEANFILCKFKKNALKIVKELEKRGIIVRYMKPPNSNKEYIRITIGTERENQILTKNLEEILL